MRRSNGKAAGPTCWVHVGGLDWFIDDEELFEDLHALGLAFGQCLSVRLQGWRDDALRLERKPKDQGKCHQVRPGQLSAAPGAATSTMHRHK